MNNEPSQRRLHKMNSSDSAHQFMLPPTVAAIEFMTFHHEVLAAFCKHTIELNINTLVISPSTGIQKAIGRFAADSFEQLKEIARLNKTELSLIISHNAKEIVTSIMKADAVFIGTVPPSPSSSTRRQANNTYSRHEEMISIVKRALKQNKLIYIVIHKPQDDAAQLVGSLDPDECKRVSTIYLSRETANFCKQLFPNRFRSELIMPTIGLLDSSSNDAGVASSAGTSMVVAGEISSKRRHYASLATLHTNRKWLRSQGIIIRIIGRIKLESWREKILRLCGLPPKWLFFVKYPSLLPLWLDGCLDLSMTRYSKVSDRALADAIVSSACLLDLKLKHYSDCGQTTGAIGLAMTHQKPLIDLEAITGIIPNNQQTPALSSLHQLIKKETKDLIAEKEALVEKFRQQLQKDLTLAISL
ncbi:hypothetical protein [Cyanobium sp. Aljojuca 7D2]|uniref:hypothetical protein n=1 Tax=Cyanobium sp. Aljojuca 7D2 TaxID=2823698 RepID=UPI0020CF6D24|nr:hypothetical protein [Cyanobium sp. Aljojuca 7D2]